VLQHLLHIRKVSRYESTLCHASLQERGDDFGLRKENSSCCAYSISFLRFTGVWRVTRRAVCTASSGCVKPSTVTRTTYGNISLIVYRRNNHHLWQKLILFSVLTENIRSKCPIFFHHSNKVGYDVLVYPPQYQLWTRRWGQQRA
jgi:hypothetical protein